MYPATGKLRDRFVLERRGVRKEFNPWLYQQLVIEDERTDQNTVARTGTVFLTGKECAWRCVMCDLWQYTTRSDTPPGAIPAQLGAAFAELQRTNQPVAQIKLYNASNFFDAHAVPESDYAAIARHLSTLDRVVVESHPALIGARVYRFLDLLRASSERDVQLEVAMGLETAQPDALERMNKGLTREQFAQAAQTLHEHGVALRVFLLISPPFIPSNEQDRWLIESVDFSFACGATAVSLIPSRGGNGAMETLAAETLFVPPHLNDIERSLDAALVAVGERPGRVFVDLWDLQRFSSCAHCFGRRRTRLHSMNLDQRRHPPIGCAHCGHGTLA
jgi:radical SAM enzyme (TIGR01210 family)